MTSSIANCLLAGLEVLALAGGLCVFSSCRFDWVRHQLFESGEVQHGGLVLPGMLLSAFVVAQAFRLKQGDARQNGLRLVSLGIAEAAVLGQWWTATASPWMLYAWMAAAATMIADRSHSVIPVRMLSLRRALWVAAFAAAAGMALHVAMQISLWRSMSLGYHDIGLFARALYSGMHGNGLWVDSLERSILGEHAFLAAWALVPVCWIVGDPFFLLVVLGPLALLSTGAIIAWYGARRGQPLFGAVAALAWLLLPMHGCLVIAHGYGFHESYLAVPVLAAGFAMGLLRRHRSAAVILLLSMLVREDIALTVAAWGAYVWLVDRRRAVGFVTAAVALAYFLVCISIIVPSFRGAPYPHLAFHFQSVPGSGFRFLAVNLSFLATLLVPMGLLPLRAVRFALIALPALAETILTTNSELHNIGFQYYVPALVVLFFAAIEGAVPGRAPDEELLPATPSGENRLLLRRSLTLLAAAVLARTWLGIGVGTNNSLTPYAHKSLVDSRERIDALRRQIPAAASVTASYRIAAHFLDASRLWTTANDALGDFVIVHDADVIDERNPRVALTRAMRTGSYVPVYADYHLVALARQDGTITGILPLRVPAMPPDVPRVNLDLGEGIRLVGMQARESSGNARVQVTIVWQCDRPVERDFRFGLTLGDFRWGPFYFARGAYPTNTWEPASYYRDDLTIDVPPAVVSELRALRPVLLE